MKAKIFRILVCIAILIGTLLGNGIKEKEKKTVLFSPTMREMDETENASEEVTVENSAAENTVAENEIAEERPVTENASGLPLMQDTVLLVTVKRTANWIIEEYEYDAEGRMLRYLDPPICDDGYGKNIEYVYDTDGNIVSKTCYEFKGDGTDSKISYWMEYSYGEDETGEVIQTEREYYKDGSLHSETVYDCEGERLKEITYREDGKFWSIYDYDPSKRQLRLTEYDKEGIIERQYRTDYDDWGNEILRVEYDAEGNISPVRGCACEPDEYIPYFRFENSYDESGNLIRQTFYDINDTQTGYRENTYDDAGYLIREDEYDAENDILYYSEYAYDEKGNKVSYFSFNEYGTDKVEYMYEYDNDGHCVKFSAVNYGEDDEGNLMKGSPYRIWERKYDADNRLIKYTDSDGDRFYYIYTIIDALDENYPFDKIKVR